MGRGPTPLTTILIADPSLFWGRTLRSALASIGMTQTVFETEAAAAMAALETQSFQAAFVDLALEGGGATFVRRVRLSRGGHRFIPVVAMAERATASRVAAARDAGASEFLAKPFSVRHVEERLTAVLHFPRDIIIAPDFLGPDRRRRRAGRPDAERRRIIPRDVAADDAETADALNARAEAV